MLEQSIVGLQSRMVYSVMEKTLEEGNVCFILYTLDFFNAEISTEDRD